MFNFRQTSIKGKLTQLTLLQRDLQTLADVVGASAAPALDFDDETAAAKTLSALEHKPGILQAVIYKKDNKPLASYVRLGASGAEGVPPQGPDGFSYVSGQLQVFRPIQRGADRLGTIFFLVDLSDLRELIVSYVIGGVVILAGALLVAFIFSSRLHRNGRIIRRGP
jgi:hypothetical protein